MIKKTIVFVFTILLFGNIYGQKLKTKTGQVNFDAIVTSFEPVKAENNATTCILDTATGEIASLILLKGFKFKVALMEEHFNENYVESDKFPKAILKGKIQNFDASKLTQTATPIEIKASIELHGKKKDVLISGKIKKTTTGIELTTSFTLIPEDFDIKIPSVVRGKIGKKVNVTTLFDLK
ncbi:YceI family protein [Flavobacterium sp.]|uniref:YceI family protein n=1 Tax=Flavobacterium sp. TaxID=239 RepID=UPI00286E9C4C|nr:YceI family protein [Flavobacterium sp.]